MNEFVNICQNVDDAVSSHKIDQSMANFCNILENVCNPLFKKNVTNNISSNIRKNNVYYSIKSAIFPSFAHVITGPKPCVNIVTRSCYSPLLPMRNTYRAQ
jgi:hypothetical protein